MSFSDFQLVFNLIDVGFFSAVKMQSNTSKSCWIKWRRIISNFLFIFNSFFRLQTWMQGSDLIGQLAQELDIPEHALTDRL